MTNKYPNILNYYNKRKSSVAENKRISSVAENRSIYIKQNTKTNEIIAQSYMYNENAVSYITVSKIIHIDSNSNTAYICGSKVCSIS